MQYRPGPFATLAIGGSLLFLSSSKPTVFAQPAPAGEPSDTQPLRPAVEILKDSGAPKPTADEVRFVELVNKERQRRGMKPLTIDPLLIQVAREHSAEMRDKAYFNHHSPTSELKTPMDRYLKAIHERPTYACVGENLFYCSVIDVQRGHNAFMNSPTHRENVLFARYEKIGVGIVTNDKGEFWVTQMFLTNRDPVQVARRVSQK